MADLHTIARLRKRNGENSWLTSYIELKPVIGTAIIQEGIDKFIDSFQCDLKNTNNRYFQQFYEGDGSTTVFTLDYVVPVVSSEPFISDHFRVFIWNDATDEWDEQPSGDWSINGAGTQITFTSAPPDSNDKTKNIRISYNVFASGDLVEVYQFENKNTYDSTDLKFVGTLKIPRVEKKTRGNIVKIRAIDLIKSLFHTKVNLTSSVDYKRTTDMIIRDIISDVFRKSGIGGSSTDKAIPLAFDLTGIATTKSDSSVFPEHEVDVVFEFAIDLIEKYSDNEFTSDGRYTYGVESDGSGAYKFFWEKRSGVSSTEITETDLKETLNEFGDEDIINIIDISAGTDVYGNHITTSVYNAESIAKNQPHIASKRSPDYGKELLESEKQSSQNNSRFTQDADGNITDDFPSDYASPSQYTMLFNDPDNPASSAQPIDDKEFNTFIKKEARRKARQEWQPVVDKYGDPPIEVILKKSRNTTKLTLGEKYKVDLTARNLPNTALRLEKIQSSNTKYTYTLREDPDDRQIGLQ